MLLQEFIFDDSFWEKRHFLFFDHSCRTESLDVRLNSEAQEYVWIAAEEALRLPIDAYTRRAIEVYLARQSQPRAAS